MFLPWMHSLHSNAQPPPHLEGRSCPGKGTGTQLQEPGTQERAPPHMHKWHHTDSNANASEDKILEASKHSEYRQKSTLGIGDQCGRVGHNPVTTVSEQPMNSKQHTPAIAQTLQESAIFNFSSHTHQVLSEQLHHLTWKPNLSSELPQLGKLDASSATALGLTQSPSGSTTHRLQHS